VDVLLWHALDDAVTDLSIKETCQMLATAGASITHVLTGTLMVSLTDLKDVENVVALEAGAEDHEKDICVSVGTQR
jgi:hypothetical protein